MSFELYIKNIQDTMRAKPTSILKEEFELYKSLLCSGTNDEIYKECLAVELDRRDNFVFKSVK